MMAKQHLFSVINSSNEKNSARPPYLGSLIVPPLKPSTAQTSSTFNFFLKSGNKELRSTKIISPNYSQSLISTNASKQQINFDQLLQNTQQINRLSKKKSSQHIVKQFSNDEQNHQNESHHKLQWKGLEKWSFYQDYLFLRDPQFLGEQAKDHLLLRQQQQDVKTVFSSLKDEKEYLDQKRRNDIEKIKEDYLFLFMLNRNSRSRSKELLQKKSGQSSFSSKYHQFEKISSEILDRITAKVQAENIEEIENLFNQLIDALKQIGLIKFYLLAYFLECTIFFLYRKYQQAYKVWKIYLRLCNSSGNVYYKYKLIAYKFMARCCQDNGEYEKSIVYLKKLLKLSWVQENRDYEMLTYDMYSIVLYYRGEIEKSMYFHSKFVDGNHENKNSKYRSVGETHYFLQGKYKERLQDQSSYSSDDFEIDLLTAHDTQRETLLEKSKSQLRIRDKGHFASKDDFKKINDYNQKFTQFGKAHHYKSNSDLTFKNLLHGSNQANEESRIGILINHLSPNRTTSKHLLCQENNLKRRHSKVQSDSIQPGIKKLKLLIKIFKRDIQHFCQNEKLCEDPLSQF